MQILLFRERLNEIDNILIGNIISNTRIRQRIAAEFGQI
jgi:hypothetical protein